MIEITPATEEHIPIIKDIAYKTWPETFGEILTQAQITYMLNMMYSENALKEQLNAGHQFLLATQKAKGHILGYLSYESPYRHLPQTKIHKIYILPSAQGLGVGRKLMEAVESIAKEKGDYYLLLNVNKHNKAEGFYKKLGFEVIGMEDIDIGSGFLMEDKIMRKDL